MKNFLLDKSDAKAAAFFGFISLLLAFAALFLGNNNSVQPSICIVFCACFLGGSIRANFSLLADLIDTAQTQQAATQAAQHAELLSTLARIAHATELTAAELAALRKPRS